MMTTRRITRGLGWALVVLLALVALLLAIFFGRLLLSRPRLTGTVVASPLSAPVTIVRDADGVPTITGRTRADVAFAEGYLHAQERFFQMDTLRRAAAGELGELVGAAGRDIDRATRLHLFRLRARRIVAGMAPADRAMLDAYVAGVNRGLGDLGAAPFEYLLLRKRPAPWRAEDTILVVYAMYLDLEDDRPIRELDRARAAARLGPAMANLLYPHGSELDAPIDGSILPPPALPASLHAPAAPPPPPALDERPVKGSNNWAVGGRLTATGAAMVANDMHLGLAIPNTWYRARLVVPGSLDAIGVTLPGAYPVVVGTNRHVAWGFTDSYIDLHDAVILDPVSGSRDTYRTPAGPRAIVTVPQRLCADGACEAFPVRMTIWGPIVARLPDGREVADRWIAHDPDAVTLGAMGAIEQARTVDDLIAAAHRIGLPDENMMMGDAAGHIAWTIIGRVPRRHGFDGQDAVSFADGSKGWAGRLAPSEIPVIRDPAAARLWTANNRVVGGAMLARLGDGTYDDGSRAFEIRRRLFATDRFAEPDMLAIQLDTTAPRLPFWRDQLVPLLAARRDPQSREMLAQVKAWDGTASAGSVGYRILRQFRLAVQNRVYAGYLGTPAGEGRGGYAPATAEGALHPLLRARPAALVPTGYASWDALLDAALGDVRDQVAADAGGRLDHFTWGAFLHPDIHHPLARAIPLLGRLTDPRDGPASGDGGTPRAQYRGTGPSERLVVSPGHEDTALFEMPGGQSGAPLAPYYLAGHDAWLEGRPTSLLPGPARWTLTLTPH